MLVIGATYLFNVVPAAKHTSQPDRDVERGELKESDNYNVEMDNVASAKEPLMANNETNEKPEPSRRRSSDGATKREA